METNNQRLDFVRSFSKTKKNAGFAFAFAMVSTLLVILGGSQLLQDRNHILILMGIDGMVLASVLIFLFRSYRCPNCHKVQRMGNSFLFGHSNCPFCGVKLKE